MLQSLTKSAPRPKVGKAFFWVATAAVLCVSPGAMPSLAADGAPRPKMPAGISLADERMARKLAEVDALIARSKAAGTVAVAIPNVMAQAVPAKATTSKAGFSSPSLKTADKSAEATNRVAKPYLNAPPSPGNGRRPGAYEAKEREEQAFAAEVRRREQEINAMYAAAAAVGVSPQKYRVLHVPNHELSEGTPREIDTRVFVDGVFSPRIAGGGGGGGGGGKYIAEPMNTYSGTGGSPIYVEKKELPMIWDARLLGFNRFKTPLLNNRQPGPIWTARPLSSPASK